MFHFPRFAPLHLWIQGRVRRHYPPWVSPFGHRRIKAWLAAPRRFSQLPTSFFASCRLGIHRVPFVAWSSLFLLSTFHLQEDQGPTHSQPSRLKEVVTSRRLSLSTPTCAYAIVKDHQKKMEPIGIEPTTSS